MNTPVEQWLCPACRAEISSAYCPACGEKRPHSRDLTLKGLVAQAVEAFTSLDARVLRTLRTLAFSPGALTNFYRDGPRKPYIGPFALFLLINVLFVAMEALTGTNAALGASSDAAMERSGAAIDSESH